MTGTFGFRSSGAGAEPPWEHDADPHEKEHHRSLEETRLTEEVEGDPDRDVKERAAREGAPQFGHRTGWTVESADEPVGASGWLRRIEDVVIFSGGPVGEMGTTQKVARVVAALVPVLTMLAVYMATTLLTRIPQLADLAKYRSFLMLLVVILAVVAVRSIWRVVRSDSRRS